ncbi:YiaA/YiaB family inner membrane protein [Streptomyces sp. NPDC047108]|uniref:YiaA/YiaB family inner membrane protein n=1 Tax=Streptomyces sp. NPDC047108 TaxID=3155025 RepID=UPI0033EC8295
MSASRHQQNTTAFFAQAAISFGISLAAVAYGIAKLSVGAWERGFLALGLIFVVTSSFTLAKCIRDRQEEEGTTGHGDKAAGWGG